MIFCCVRISCKNLCRIFWIKSQGFHVHFTQSSHYGGMICPVRKTNWGCTPQAHSPTITSRQKILREYLTPSETCNSDGKQYPYHARGHSGKIIFDIFIILFHILLHIQSARTVVIWLRFLCRLRAED